MILQLMGTLNFPPMGGNRNVAGVRCSNRLLPIGWLSELTLPAYLPIAASARHVILSENILPASAQIRIYLNSK